jgi:hypothetical protein
MGFSFFVGETNEMRSAAKNVARCSGFVSDLLAGLKTRHYIGRQAPVKRCLARLRGLRPAVLRLNFEKRVEDCAEVQRKNLAIRKHLSNCGDVPGADQGQLLELAHAAGALGSGEMAFAGMGAHDFTGGGDFETLGGAAVRFQFLFWLCGISWHC